MFLFTIKDYHKRKYLSIYDTAFFMFRHIIYKKYTKGVIMLPKIYSFIILISFTSAVFLQKIPDIGIAAIESASESVIYILKLSGVTILWCGIMKVFEEAGFIKKLSVILKPVLKFVFPNAYNEKNALEEISANMGANMLGLSNAATPVGLKAIEKLKKNDKASDDMVMLTVLNTTSIQIIPTTLLSLRILGKSASPFEILIPIWICSAITFVFTVLITKFMSRFFK